MANHLREAPKARRLLRSSTNPSGGGGKGAADAAAAWPVYDLNITKYSTRNRLTDNQAIRLLGAAEDKDSREGP